MPAALPSRDISLQRVIVDFRHIFTSPAYSPLDPSLTAMKILSQTQLEAVLDY